VDRAPIDQVGGSCTDGSLCYYGSEDWYRLQALKVFASKSAEASESGIKGAEAENPSNPNFCVANGINGAGAIANKSLVNPILYWTLHFCDFRNSNIAVDCGA
jgi:hypothetical protein